jgi:hypothetical protein
MYCKCALLYQQNQIGARGQTRGHSGFGKAKGIDEGPLAGFSKKGTQLFFFAVRLLWERNFETVIFGPPPPAQGQRVRLGGGR